MAILVLSVLCGIFVLGHGAVELPAQYNVGVGIADITGPAAEVNMMGYANPAQTTAGIHLRQFSRAFIFSDVDGKAPVVYVNIDGCMFSQGVKLEIIKRLQKSYKDLYNERNICISGTHTHSGPGGFHQYILYDITSLGFVRESFDALVEGIVLSIERAHKNIQPANIYINSGELLDSNINRSPTAYLRNPEEERKKYEYDTDKDMTVLKIVDKDENPIAMLCWFAVHCTSMNNTNHLISSDNKGIAALMFEKDMNGPDVLPGKGQFVAGFGQSNLGDVSPNTKGPHCLDTGKACDTNTSTCNGKNELCVAAGPGKDMFDSTYIIGKNQYQKAMDLFNQATIPLSGPVKFRHTYTDMTKQTMGKVRFDFNPFGVIGDYRQHFQNLECESVAVLNGDGFAFKTFDTFNMFLERSSVIGTNTRSFKIGETEQNKTCKPAMGYSFAAGTTDGPGAFDFKQSTTSPSVFWNFISHLIKKPTPEQTACHQPKPILLDTGEISEPYAWSPAIVDTQIFTIGQLAIIAVPGEFTTMSGRRTRDAVAKSLVDAGFENVPVPVIAGLSNDYADYITTYEEYQQQRYEGASTIYGPHTLQAYIEVFKNLSKALAQNEPVSPGPVPPNLVNKQFGFLPPVIVDTPEGSHSFGYCIVQPKTGYKGNERVSVTFVGANPRNNRKQESTFLEVQFKEQNGTWSTLYTDAHWETRFMWKSANAFGGSEITIIWDIPADAKPGVYRIVYNGDSKALTGTITPFTGASNTFTVDMKDSKMTELLKKKYRVNKKNRTYLDKLKKVFDDFDKKVDFKY